MINGITVYGITVYGITVYGITVYGITVYGITVCGITVYWIIRKGTGINFQRYPACLALVQSVNQSVCWLTESVCLGPKVTPLYGPHCILYLFKYLDY